jgi:diadenosine tetraphosphatase ApaH/serine/threonine PP2A family protein phosphatase
VRYLVISDIHGNLEALEAVLTALDSRYDEVLVLGDLVGYGADPNAVVDRIRGLQPRAVIRGNHDKVAAGLDDGESFNLVARSAVNWTTEELAPANREYLLALPEGPVAIDDTVEICHGSPLDEDHYIFDELDALRGFEKASRRLCLFGHTHMAVVYRRADRIAIVAGPGDTSGVCIKLDEDPEAAFLVNPGSVGQPRDGDPRAGAGIVDTGTREVELFRVPYPIDVAAGKIRRAGLPDILARRLSLGR